jgi:hypothetical protein
MPSDKHVVTAADVAELFREAKAPVVPEGKLRDLADAMTMMAARYLYARQKIPPKPETLWQEAQHAADKLRVAVQKIIVGHTVWAEFFRQTGSLDRAVEQEAEVERLKRFLDELPDFVPPVPKGPLWPDPKTGKRPTTWHSEAELLLRLYRESVDPNAGASRMGPAVRFVDRVPAGGVGARGRSCSPAGLAGYVRRPRRAA